MKGTVKTIDKSAIAAQRMKNTFIRTKESAEQTQAPQDAKAEDYAVRQVEEKSDRAARTTAGQIKKQGGKAVRKVQEARRNSKEAKKAADYAADPARRPSVPASHQPGKNPAPASRSRIKTAVQKGRDIKRSARSVKETGKSAVKTAQRTVKTAKAAAKTAQKAAQAARAAAKTAAAAAKATARAVAAAVKAIIAGTKALIAAIAAGGWVAVVVILVICVVAFIVGSGFGIFFSNESSGGPTMQSVVLEINTEYTAKLDEIKTQNPHDVVEISGARIDWPEVLAVYAVKTSSTQEVATIDDQKKAVLKSIFWDANTINHRTESREVTEVTVTVDEDGNLVESTSTVTKDFLLITVSHKSADELAAQYGFNESQKQQLAELLLPENDSMWSAVLTGTEGADMVSVALSQIGNTGGEPYWRWYGFTSRAEWCACFVSWCAEQCGYIQNGIIPKFAACTSQGMPWFKDRGLWQPGSYTPNPGDIIFFNWAEADGSRDGLADHVGIVEHVADGRVYTIEGNSGDEVKQNSYPLGYTDILGYGIPQY